MNRRTFLKAAGGSLTTLAVSADQALGTSPAPAARAQSSSPFVATWFPALRSQPIVETKVCQYEDSVNEHFIVDRHPAFEHVWLVGGGSGHGRTSFHAWQI